MELSDFRWSALARYHDAALESGVVLLGLVRCPVHSHFDSSLWSLMGVRSNIRIMTELQQFSISARKAIEIANLVAPDLTSLAKTIRVGEPDTIIYDIHQGEIRLCDQSFWWVISRIIHSVSSMVWGQDKHLASTPTRIYSERRNEYFFFSSDKDKASATPGSYAVKAEQRHCVKVENLLSIYSGQLAGKIEDAIKTLRTPRD